MLCLPFCPVESYRFVMHTEIEYYIYLYVGSDTRREDMRSRLTLFLSNTDYTLNMCYLRRSLLEPSERTNDRTACGIGYGVERYAIVTNVYVDCSISKV